MPNLGITRARAAAGIGAGLVLLLVGGICLASAHEYLGLCTHSHEHSPQEGGLAQDNACPFCDFLSCPIEFSHFAALFQPSQAVWKSQRWVPVLTYPSIESGNRWGRAPPFFMITLQS